MSEFPELAEAVGAFATQHRYGARDLLHSCAQGKGVQGP